MKKYYELVCVVDARLSMDEINAQKTTIESLLGDDKVALDDMGLLPLAYPMKGQSQAYFLSYAISGDAASLETIKRALSIEKGVIKYHVFSLKSPEAFLKYADLKKTYLDLLPQEEEVAEEEVEEEVAAKTPDVV